MLSERHIITLMNMMRDLVYIEKPFTTDMRITHATGLARIIGRETSTYTDLRPLGGFKAVSLQVRRK